MFYRNLLPIIFLAVTLLTPHIAHAQSNFSLAFDVVYVFDEQGNASVTKRITLTNLNTDTYPSVYLADVPDDASGIAAFNESGKLETETVYEGGRKMVRLPLSYQNVGFNRKTGITLSYDTRVLAQREGTTWLIAISPFSTDEDIVSYKSTVIPPEAWGEPSYVSPDSQTPGVWTMDEHQDETIVMAFGEISASSASDQSTESKLDTNIVLAGTLVGAGLTIALFFLFARLTKRHIHQ